MESTHFRQGLTDKVKIIADDLGLAESVNDGIIFLLKEGKIDGASLMVNEEAFDDAVEKLKSFPDADIGIHFVLIEEKPLALKKLPKNYKVFFIKYVLGLIKSEDVEKELRAQLNKCVGAGIKPAFINSHQHLHLLPGIADITVKLAKEFNIPYIRIVKERVSLNGGKLFRQAQLLFLNFLSRLAKSKIRKAGLKCNDFFVGFINAGDLDANDIALAKELSQKHPDKIIELGCHPGYKDESLIAKYRHWEYNWSEELNKLCDL